MKEYPNYKYQPKRKKKMKAASRVKRCHTTSPLPIRSLPATPLTLPHQVNKTKLPLPTPMFLNEQAPSAPSIITAPSSLSSPPARSLSSSSPASSSSASSCFSSSSPPQILIVADDRNKDVFYTIRIPKQSPTIPKSVLKKTTNQATQHHHQAPQPKQKSLDDSQGLFTAQELSSINCLDDDIFD